MQTYLRKAGFVVVLAAVLAACGGGDKKTDARGQDQTSGDGLVDAVPPDQRLPSDGSGDGRQPADEATQDTAVPTDGAIPGDTTTPADGTEPADLQAPDDTVTPGDGVEPQDLVLPDGQIDVPAEDTGVPAAVVGPDGGEVEGPAGAKLVIPAGALDKTVVFTMSEVTSPHKGSFAAAGKAVDIGPAGTKFLKPATLTFLLDEPAGPGFVSVFTAEGKDKPWEALGTSSDGQKLTASVTHLSWFQPGVSVIKTCDDLCYYLIPCMVEMCGLAEPELSQMPSNCMTTCGQYPPVEGIIDPAKIQDCNDLITLLVPYSLTLLEVCTVEPGSCADSVKKIFDCLAGECPNIAPYKVGFGEFMNLNCQKSPEAIAQVAMMSCTQIKEYLTKNDKGLASLCSTGPALSGADCTKLKQGFVDCPPPPETPLATVTPEFIDYYFCALGMFGLETLQCAIGGLPDCGAFWGCLP